MPILTPDQKAAIRAESGKPAYAGLTPAGIADALNAATTVANPAPRAQVPRVLKASEVLSLLSPASAQNLKAVMPILATIIDMINGQQAEALVEWAGLLVAWEDIAPSEAQAIAAYASATVPDPAYQATVAGPNWVRTNLPDAALTTPDGVTHEGQVTAEIVAEALT